MFTGVRGQAYVPFILAGGSLRGILLRGWQNIVSHKKCGNSGRLSLTEKVAVRFMYDIVVGTCRGNTSTSRGVTVVSNERCCLSVWTGVASPGAKLGRLCCDLASNREDRLRAGTRGRSQELGAALTLFC